MSDERDDTADDGRDVNAAFSEEDYLPDPEEDERLLADYPGDPPTPVVPYPRKPKGKKKGRSTKSDLELEARIDDTLRMLNEDWPVSAIKKKLMADYGCSYRMTANYIAHAEKVRERWARLSNEDEFKEAIAFNKGVLRDPRRTMQEKFHARERIDYLKNIEPAPRLELTGKGGRPIEHDHAVRQVSVTEVIVTTREEARAVLAAPATPETVTVTPDGRPDQDDG